jgi:hypothetical protein
MVPSAFVVLESFPMTPSGKLDRRALPIPELQAYASGPHEEPQGDVEVIIAAIWCELLGVTEVGRNDNFFELGGHSLSLLAVQTKVQKQFAVRLPLKRYFENPTLAAMAGAVQEEVGTAAAGGSEDLAQMAALLDLLED